MLDADTVTGHVATSLGMEGCPTVVDAWRDEAEGGPAIPFLELASAHPSGMRVLPLTSSPIHTEVLDPERVAGSSPSRAGASTSSSPTSTRPTARSTGPSSTRRTASSSRSRPTCPRSGPS